MRPLDMAEKERLVEEFRACLEEIEAGADSAEGDPVDLRSLLAEMAALKNEVRLESRQFKAALEELRGLSNALQERNDRLSQELERSRRQSADAQRQGERGLLLGVLDLRDRLQAGVEAAAARKPSALLRWLSTDERYARALIEGMALTLQRADELLESHRVRPVSCLDQRLDPQHMRVVGVEARPDRPEGMVLREVRRGFFHEDELLRAADVIVNRTNRASA